MLTPVGEVAAVVVAADLAGAAAVVSAVAAVDTAAAQCGSRGVIGVPKPVE